MEKRRGEGGMAKELNNDEQLNVFNFQKLLEFLIKFQKKFGVIYKKLNQIDEENGSLMAYELIPTIGKARAEFQEDKFLINKFTCLRNMDQYLTVDILFFILIQI